VVCTGLQFDVVWCGLLSFIMVCYCLLCFVVVNCCLGLLWWFDAVCGLFGFTVVSW